MLHGLGAYALDAPSSALTLAKPPLGHTELRHMLKTTTTAALLLATLASAQRNKVLPAPALENDANASAFTPFIYSGGARTQHLIAGDAITTGTAVLREFAYRRDTQNTRAFAARMIPNYTVTIGYCKASPASMSNNFAANRSGTQTVVFKGTYALPAQPAVRGVGAFNVVFKLPTPFLYRLSSGNLLLEFVETGQATQKNEYYLDAWREGAGYAATFGSNGPLKSNANYSVVCSATDALAPGGSIDIRASGLDRAYPSAVIYGFSNLSYGTIQLPFDLTPLGAAGNMAYVSIDLVVPLALTQSGSAWSGARQLPIPKVAGIAGLSVFAQAIFLDPTSNGFGSVWSNGVAMTIGGEARMQMLYQSSSTQATGSFLFGSRSRGGPVVQLNGGLR